MSLLLAAYVEYAHSRALDRSSFLVGGGVRDLLIDAPLKDVDVAVDGDPCVVAKDFASVIKASFVVLDAEYGIFRVVRDDQSMDFTPLRGGSIERDLAERDLTINAMALPLAFNEPFGALISEMGPSARGREYRVPAAAVNELPFIDPFGGRRDLTCRIVRMVSEDNFLKDPLRLLRAHRFEATLGFAIEVQTASAVRRHASLISTVAVERIMEEIRLILASGYSSGAIESMESNGLLQRIFPEMEAISQEERLHNRQSFRYVEHILRNLSLYFPQHSGTVSAGLASPHRKVMLKIASLLNVPSVGLAAAERLKMSGRERDLLRAVLGHADALQKDLSAPEMVLLLKTIGDRVCPVVVYGISRDLVCHGADNPVLTRARRMLVFYSDRYLPRQAMLPVITGKDLLREFRLSPSPLIGRVLEGVETGFLAGTISSREEALALAERLIAEEE